MNAKTKLLFALFVLTTMLFTTGDCRADTAPASIASADLAFDEGQHDEALALYDQVLKDDPDNLHALVRSGMLLSWNKKYTEAIQRYDRALVVNPNNYKAQIERAKVLSWSRQFDDALAAFSTVVDGNPDDREARLGLARVYSWSGKQTRAREQYLVLVESNPRDAEALVGVAQTYSWSGDSTTALGWYEKALAAEPGKLEAVLGRSYVDLWSGERGRAVASADELERRFPGNPEVAVLQFSIDDAMSFWFRTTFDSIEDTDNNDLDVVRVEVGDAITPNVEYRIGATRNKMRSLFGEATTDRAAGALSFLPGGGHRIDLAIGSDRTEDTFGDTDSEVVGGVTWAFGSNRNTSGYLALNRDTLVYSTPIADARIGYDAITSVLVQKIKPTVALEVRGSILSFTDDNDRAGYDAIVRWTPRTKGVVWLLGAGYRSFSYDQDLDNGYFDPQDFSTYFALLGGRGTFGSSAATWDITAEVGTQSFTLGGIETSDDQTLSGALTLGFPMGKWAVLELYTAHSDSAMQTATGFESDQYGVRLRVQRRR